MLILISSGFDVSFNYKDVFYKTSLIPDGENGKNYMFTQLQIMFPLLGK